MNLLVLPMDIADLRVVLGWAKEEGWKPGDGDAEPFLAADPGGFLIGRLDGEPVASVSGVRYGRGYGFIGLYICRPEFRGRGYGLTMFRKVMDMLGDRVIGLDGVLAQVPNYQRSGFATAYGNMRHAAQLSLDAPSDPRLRPVDAALIPAIKAFDRAHVPEPRDGFLDVWLTGDDRTAIALVEDGAVAGYGVIRDADDGYRIGPLFAANEADADALFRALCAARPGGMIYLDIPVPNAAARALTARYGMEPMFETARMYRGPAPALPLDRIFGVTTLEVG
ncbi:MAG: GNAT family N-acetyltransferase [Bauldia sp.]